jgi:hypothetical protein
MVMMACSVAGAAVLLAALASADPHSGSTCTLIHGVCLYTPGVLRSFESKSPTECCGERACWLAHKTFRCMIEMQQLHDVVATGKVSLWLADVRQLHS